MLPGKIKIECELFGALSKKFKQNKVLLTIPKGLTYKDLLVKYLGFKQKYLRYFSIVINDNRVENLSSKITKKQKITVLLPLSGG